jgi:hypothetical protein
MLADLREPRRRFFMARQHGTSKNESQPAAR